MNHAPKPRQSRRSWPKPGEKFGGGEQKGVAPLDAIEVVVVGLDAGAEGVFLLLLGGKGADDAIVRHAFVEEADDTVPVADVPTAFKTQAAAVPAVIDDQERDEEDRDERELPVEIKEPRMKTPDAVVRSPMRETEAPVTSWYASTPAVLGDAGNDAAGLAFLVKLEREFLEMGKDGDAHVAGDVHAGGLHEMVARPRRRSGAGEEKEGVETVEAEGWSGTSSWHFRDDEIEEPVGAWSGACR